MSVFTKENDDFDGLDVEEIADRMCLKQAGFSEEEIDTAIERKKEGGGDSDDDEDSITTEAELKKMFRRYAKSADEEDDGYITLRALKDAARGACARHERVKDGRRAC